MLENCGSAAQAAISLYGMGTANVPVIGSAVRKRVYPPASYAMTRHFLTALATTAILTLPACSPAGDDLVERMGREHAGDTPAPSPAAGVEPAGEIAGSAVTYARIGDTDIEGYLARPAGDGPFPGVIVIQEWWGLNDNIKRMADRLAGEGYLALAVDMYEGEVATDRDGAMKLMRASMEQTDRLEENLRQAHGYLDAQGAIRVGSVGWCFGGGWSLRAAALLGDDLDAAVIYYGRVMTEESDLAPISAPILGLFGELDGGIPVESVREFEAAMEAMGKSASIHVYPDADHAFANPSGSRYNETAATDAWEKTLAFFEQHLGG